jgi:hypothetical protein
MIPERDGIAETAGRPRRPYEPPAVIEVFVDPAKDMLVACAPGKLPHSGDLHCNAVHFT